MWRFLVGLGLLLVLAGLIVVALGVAIFVSSFGNTLIAAGTICMVGGGTLAAIGLVLRELNDISARLDAVLGAGLRAPAVAPAQTYYDDAPEDDYLDDAPEAPVHTPVQAPIAAPLAPPAQEPVAAPPPRSFSPPPFLRSSFERPAPAPPPAPAATVLPELDLDDVDDEPAAPAPLPPLAPEPASRLPEALQRGRILGRLSENSPFPVRPRPEPTPAPEPDSMPERQPERSLFGTRAFTPPSRRPDAPPAAPAPAAPAPYAPPSFSPPSFTPPPAAIQPPAPALSSGGEEPTVLKSGVVGGMAYTLYSDGSIQAELPDGTLRFASLQELRDHVARSAQKPN